MIGCKPMTAAFMLLFGTTLQGCQSSSGHPTAGACGAPKRAAAQYFAMISNKSTDDVSFVPEEYAEGLSAFRVYASNRTELGTIVVRNEDCTLQFFTDSALQTIN
jgi:hypothetical protein